MSPGLPGLGLGGLFFLLSALIAPFVELARSVRGRTSPGAWRQVGRQFSMAVLMIVTLDLTLRGALALGGAAGIGAGPPGGDLIVMSLSLLGFTLGLLLTVLAVAKGLQLVLRMRANSEQDRRRRERRAADLPVARGGGGPLDESV